LSARDSQDRAIEIEDHGIDANGRRNAIEGLAVRMRPAYVLDGNRLDVLVAQAFVAAPRSQPGAASPILGASPDTHGNGVP
jgi:hypothetical protein